MQVFKHPCIQEYTSYHIQKTEKDGCMQKYLKMFEFLYLVINFRVNITPVGENEGDATIFSVSKTSYFPVSQLRREISYRFKINLLVPNKR